MTLPAQVGNHVGLTGGLRRALSGVRSWRDHDPGVVARDVAVMLVDGGDCVSDLAVRDPQLLWRAPRAGAPDRQGARRLKLFQESRPQLLRISRQPLPRRPRLYAQSAICNWRRGGRLFVADDTGRMVV